MTPVDNPRVTTQWIRDRLLPVRDGDRVTFRVGSIVPTGFEAYCRIFHPAYRRVTVAGKTEHRPVRWRQVAEDNGKVFHNLAHWHTFLGRATISRFQHPEWGTTPKVGELDHREAGLLASLLSRNTGTPHRCNFAWWEGGFHGDRKRLEAVEIGEYQYFVYQRELDETPPRDSPNLWWPEDRAWCVATDVDSFFTILGGSQDCVNKVLFHNEFEALPVNVYDPMVIAEDSIDT